MSLPTNLEYLEELVGNTSYQYSSKCEYYADQIFQIMLDYIEYSGALYIPQKMLEARFLEYFGLNDTFDENIFTTSINHLIQNGILIKYSYDKDLRPIYKLPRRVRELIDEM